MERSVLIAETRARMGNPSASEVDNIAISCAIDSALGELSVLQPYFTYHSIDIIKNTNIYAVAENIMDVKDFVFTPRMHYVTGMENFNLFENGAMPVSSGGEYADLKVFHSPSLLNIIEEKWERLKSRYNYDWEFNIDTKELFIIPTPTAAGKGMYKGIIQRDLNNINVKHLAAFKDLVRAMSMETWVSKLSMFKSIPVGVGKIDYEPRQMISSARDLKRDALRRLSSGGSGVVIG